MSADWKPYALESLGKIVTGKTPPSRISDSFVDAGTPFVTPRDMDGRRWIDSTERYLSKNGVEAVKNSLVPMNSVAVSCIGSDMGKAVLLAADSVTNQQINSIIVNEELFNPKFIYYTLSTKQQELKDIAGGSATPILNKGHFGKFEILAPNKPIQDLIVQQLDSLDSKIELNRQTNQTLENIAQAIFKSWFVDFEPTRAKIAAKENGQDPERAAMAAISGKTLEEIDQLFAEHEVHGSANVAGTGSAGATLEQLKTTAALFPDALVDSELGEIPEGWETKQVEEVCETTDYVANGSFKALKENVTLYDEPNDVLYVRTTDFNKGFSNDLKYTDIPSYEFLKKSRLFGRETIISNVGDVGTVFRAPKWFDLPMTLGSNAVSLISEEYSAYLFWLFRSHEGQSLLNGIVTGSAQLKFNKTNLRSLEILWPSNEVLETFEILELVFHKKINSTMKEISQLERVRDSLLPKLLSGELEVAAA